jgi:uncharacterized protein
MLELRPNCEHCDRNLPPQSTEAYICTYECTFCLICANEVLKRVCPNCGGNLVERPIRPPNCLLKDPASTKRIGKVKDADGQQTLSEGSCPTKG